MNIISALVGVTIMGAAAPSVMQMSIAPVEAQKRAENFGIAESAAVTFAAQHEGTTNDPKDTDTCDVTQQEGSDDAFSVSCSHGTGRYRQTVVRAFRLQVSSTYTNPTRQFAWDTPAEFSHVECPVNDPWGVAWYNEHLAAGHLKACLPAPVWSRTRYLESNPNDWLFDLSDWGYGRHPDF